MSEKSELDFLHHQLFKYAEDIARLYQELKTGYSKDEIEDMIKRPEAFAEIITNSKEMLAIFLYIESISQTFLPVLITGETGVGKELIARSIHSLSGLKGPFVAINVAGLDDNLFSDAIFGHIKGAFTGADKVRRGLVEKASGGTLFLDEIGDLSLVSQAKLLRLLQEREYLPLGQDEPKKTDVRIVTATNQDLWALQRVGKFRKDLNFRLRIHHIYVPPLRERMDDIPLLMDHLLGEAARALNKKKPTLPKEVFKLLGTYSFPGNVRELQTMVFDAVSRHKARILSLEVFKSHIAREYKDSTVPAEVQLEETALLTFSTKLPSIKQATQLLVAEAMKRADGNQSVAARILGISHQALSKRLKSES
ncbi:MAG: sigma-54-dependent Fis family transcriptional regulator [Candidatus Aminicenantes bacterium]|nr:MAG: sigma-54-dependent Fis family transcriptional regulator [Candidatus Aminicenantes bacterium]